MAQFTALDPGVEVSGAAILSTIVGLENDVTPLLEKYGITRVEPDAWYLQQHWLDILKAISEGRGSRGPVMDLVSIGMRIPDHALWPPDVDSIESALFSIDIAYQMNHRGGRIGSYGAERTGDKHIRMVCDNPYPSDFDYGIIYRTTQKFLPEKQMFIVERADTPSRLKGDDRCIYNVTWG